MVGELKIIGLCDEGEIQLWLTRNVNEEHCLVDYRHQKSFPGMASGVDR